jgi:hypothetical protein
MRMRGVRAKTETGARADKNHTQGLTLRNGSHGFHSQHHYVNILQNYKNTTYYTTVNKLIIHFGFWNGKKGLIGLT